MKRNSKRLLSNKQFRIAISLVAFLLSVVLSILLFRINQKGGDPSPAYFYYGHFYMVVYLLVFFSIVSSPAIFKRWHRVTLLILVTIAAAANIFVYWVGEFLTAYFRYHSFFTFEVPAIFLLLLVTGLNGFVQKKELELLKRQTALFISLISLVAGILSLVFVSYFSQAPLIAMTFVFLIASIYGRAAPSVRAYPLSIFVSVSLIVLLLAGSRFVAYQPSVLPGPIINKIASLPGNPHTQLELHVFNTGFNRMSKALSPGTPPWRPAPAFVIRHPDLGMIVFDCGLSHEVAKKGEAALPFPMPLAFESRGAVGRTLDEQMKKEGMDPLEVRYVVLSHLHEDHTGTLASFKNALVIIGSLADTDIIKEGTLQPLSAFSKTTTPLGPGWDLAGDKSLLLIAGGGHTREDLLLWIASAEGPILLSGDAVVHWDWLKSNDVERVAVNKPRSAETRNQIRKLLEVVEGMVLFPGHDTPNITKEREDIIVHNPFYFRQESWSALK